MQPHGFPSHFNRPGPSDSVQTIPNLRNSWKQYEIIAHKTQLSLYPKFFQSLPWELLMVLSKREPPAAAHNASPAKKQRSEPFFERPKTEKRRPPRFSCFTPLAQTSKGIWRQRGVSILALLILTEGNVVNWPNCFFKKKKTYKHIDLVEC